MISFRKIIRESFLLASPVFYFKHAICLNLTLSYYYNFQQKRFCCSGFLCKSSSSGILFDDELLLPAPFTQMQIVPTYASAQRSSPLPSFSSVEPPPLFMTQSVSPPKEKSCNAFLLAPPDSSPSAMSAYILELVYRSSYARELLRDAIREPSLEIALRDLAFFCENVYLKDKNSYSQSHYYGCYKGDFFKLQTCNDVDKVDILFVRFLDWYYKKQAPQKVSMTTPWEWFPRAREMRRKFIFHCGVTNSGKTHAALKKLIRSKSGIYCAPLKALAAQVWRKIDEYVPCDLLIGDERRFGGSAEHVSCTMEMCPVDLMVDVAVIDEIQMLEDPERGWAWTRALLGVPAKEVFLCGEARALEPIKELLYKTKELNSLTVVKHNRLIPLSIGSPLDGSLASDKVQNGDCFVVYSRKRVFEVKSEIERENDFQRECTVAYEKDNDNIRDNSNINKSLFLERKVAVKVHIMYGSLPFAVREMQCEAFNKGVVEYYEKQKQHGKELHERAHKKQQQESQSRSDNKVSSFIGSSSVHTVLPSSYTKHVLVSTDAIAYGLNLNIKRIVFTTVEKFNGRVTVRVPQSSLLQVAGRAGRYGLQFSEEGGVVTTLFRQDLPYVKEAFVTPLPYIAKVGLLPTIDILLIYAEMKVSQLAAEMKKKKEQTIQEKYQEKQEEQFKEQQRQRLPFPSLSSASASTSGEITNSHDRLINKNEKMKSKRENLDGLLINPINKDVNGPSLTFYQLIDMFVDEMKGVKQHSLFFPCDMERSVLRIAKVLEPLSRGYSGRWGRENLRKDAKKEDLIARRNIINECKDTSFSSFFLDRTGTTPATFKEMTNIFPSNYLPQLLLKDTIIFCFCPLSDSNPKCFDIMKSYASQHAYLTELLEAHPDKPLGTSVDIVVDKELDEVEEDVKRLWEMYLKSKYNGNRKNIKKENGDNIDSNKSDDIVRNSLRDSNRHGGDTDADIYSKIISEHHEENHSNRGIEKNENEASLPDFVSVQRLLQRLEFIYRMTEVYGWLSWRFGKTFTRQLMDTKGGWGWGEGGIGEDVFVKMFKYYQKKGEDNNRFDDDIESETIICLTQHNNKKYYTYNSPQWNGAISNDEGQEDIIFSTAVNSGEGAYRLPSMTVGGSEMKSYLGNNNVLALKSKCVDCLRVCLKMIPKAGSGRESWNEGRRRMQKKREIGVR